MIIKVIGAGCDKCDELYLNVEKAVEQLGMDAQIEKVEDLIEMVKLGVMTSPAVMLNGKLVVSGRVADVKALVEIFSVSI